MINSKASGTEDSNGFKFSPALLRTESEEEFAKLVEELNRDAQPANIIGRMYVHDFAVLTFEKMRLRRFKIGIAYNASRLALENILRSLAPAPTLSGISNSVRMDKGLAFDWFRGDKNAKELVLSLLQEAGLDEWAIEAEAFRLTLSENEKIDCLLTSVEARSEKCLRAIGRYNESLAAKLRESSERVLAADTVPSVAPSEMAS